MEKKRMLSVIKWSNGFVNIIKVVGEHEGAMLEEEVNVIVDDMAKKAGIAREDVEIRVFHTDKVEIKNKL